MSTDIKIINAQVTKELANKETLQTLVTTTFKGLDETSIKQAMVEGMLRGFTFEDFLQKNVYAIPFGKTYSLVTSVDYARKVGMRSGVVGSSEPTFEEKDGKIISCSVTIKRKVQNDIGDFTAKVYFDEYKSTKGLWTSKPRTMIAKVAEMHALRKACPEELSQMYTTDELTDIQVVEKKSPKAPEKLEPVDVFSYEAKLTGATTLTELKKEWSAIPFEAKTKLEVVKEQMKIKLTPKK